MIDSTGLELLRQIHDRCIQIDSKLDKKANRKDHEELEERVLETEKTLRETEKTLTKHRTVFSIGSAGLAVLFGLSR